MIEGEGNAIDSLHGGGLGSGVRSLSSSSVAMQENQEILHMDNDNVELITTTMALTNPLSTLDDEPINNTDSASSFLPPLELVDTNDFNNEYDVRQHRFNTGSISSNRVLQESTISLLPPSSTPILQTTTVAPSSAPFNDIINVYASTVDPTTSRGTNVGGGGDDPTLSPSLGAVEGSEDYLVTSTDTDIIRETLRLYGSFYLLCFTIFCFARKRYPRLYNIRSWVPELHCKLATESIVDKSPANSPKAANSTEDDDSVSSPQSQADNVDKNNKNNSDDADVDSSSTTRITDEVGLMYGISGSGYIKWMKNIYKVTDTEMLEQCGLDATCFLRCLRLGWHFSLFGIFISLWLIPIFLTAEESPDTEYLTDMFVISSVANIPPGSQRFLAVVVAAYLITFYGLHMITKEYDWYISMRHKFLSQRLIRNYSIYVSGIPPEFRSSFALRDYFQNCSWHSAVVDCHIAMEIPKLEAKVAKRNKIVKKLEHVIALEKRRGVTHTHRKFLLPSYAIKRFLPRWFRKASNTATRQRVFSDGSYDFETDVQVTERVDTVEEYQKELKQLNRDISLAIGKTHRMNDKRRRNLCRSSVTSSRTAPTSFSASRNLFGTGSSGGSLHPIDDDDDIQENIATGLSPIKEVNSASPSTSPSSAISASDCNKNQTDSNNNTSRSAITLETAGVSTSTLGQLEPIMEDIIDSHSHHHDVHTPYNASSGGSQDVNENENFQQDLDGSPHPFLQLLGLDPVLSPKIQRNGATGIATTGDSALGDDELMLHHARSADEDEVDGEEEDAASDADDSSNEVEITFFRDSGESNDDDSFLDSVTDASGNDNIDIENGLRDNRKVLTSSQAASGSSLGSGSGYGTDDSLTPGGGRKTKRNWHRVSSGRRLLGDAAGQVTGGVKKVGAKGVKVGRRVAETGVGGVKHVGAKGVKVGKLVAETGVEGVKRVAGSSVGKGVMRVAESGVNQLRTPDSFVGATLAAGGSLVAESAALVAPMLRNSEDGHPRDAGFVVFRDLYTTQAARQMLQHHVPGHMAIDAAPAPDDVIWRNVGLSEKALRSGKLLSLAASITLAFFWSIPMAFLSSLTEVHSLKQKLKFLERWTEAFPGLEGGLALIAPLLLLILNEGALPYILEIFSTWEGHIGQPTLESAVFVKLSVFVMVQTFFVSAISGSITAEISNILDDPENIIDLLANSLPAQSSYFIQIIVVYSFFVHAFDLIRAHPLGAALFRRCIGPNLTAKERRTTFGWFNSLEDPPPFYHAEVGSFFGLFFVVYFVYAPIAPITCVFLALCFGVCETGYRYHFIHNMRPSPDSGGKIWPSFVWVILVSMLIGQLTLIGLMTLKKNLYTLPALAPLMAMTVLYMILVVPKRYAVSKSLPTNICAEIDKKYGATQTGSNMSVIDEFGKEQYLQPALKHPKVFPEEEEEEEEQEDDNNYGDADEDDLSV